MEGRHVHGRRLKGSGARRAGNGKAARMDSRLSAAVHSPGSRTFCARVGRRHRPSRARPFSNLGTQKMNASEFGPLLVSYDDVAGAARRIEGKAHRTPVLTSETVNKRTGADVYFKCENFQRM